MNAPEFVSLIARAERLAADGPEALLYAWADEHGRIVERVTRRQTLARAAHVAEQLRASKLYRPGERVLLVYPPGLHFVWALLGCLAAGLVPVPVYPPHPSKAADDIGRLARVASDANCTLALTDRNYRWVLRWLQFKGFLLGARMPALDWMVTSAAESSSALRPVARGPDDVAVLQYTSGSTGDPHGVAITFGNLEHQFRTNREVLRFGEGSRALGWVPQYHDLGLISGILSSAWGNGALLLTSPITFLRRPGVWFDLATEFRATHTAGPNFSFGLLLRRTTPEQRSRWRLDSLEVLMSAAEPIDARLMATFFDEMAPHGLRPEAFCPAYGLAEHTVGVTLEGKARFTVERQALERDGALRPATDSASATTLVGCGRPAPGVDVRVVNPETRVECEDARVGEIWVRSPSVAAGYHGRAAESRATFGAHLATGEGPWLRTGDLGALYEGELVVTGRLKDLLIVGGRNLYPQDLEATATAAHPAVRPGCVAAFALPGHDTDAVGLAADLRDGRDAAEVAEAIRRAVRKHHGVGLAKLALGSQGLVLKTTSGKIRRRATAAALQDGSLARTPAWIGLWTDDADPVEQSPAEADDELARALRGLADLPRARRFDAAVDALSRAAGDVVGREPFAPAWTFQEQGLESLMAVEFVARLGRALDARVPLDQLALHATPRRLAHYVLGALGLAYDAPDGAPAGEDEERITRAPWPVWRRPSPAASRVAVVGAGVGGLVAAHELSRLGYRDVTVFEAGEEPGGKVLSLTVDGTACEIGATFLSETYTELFGLVEELGLSVTVVPGASQNATPEGLADSAPPAVTDRWIERAERAAGGPIGDHWASGFGHRAPSLAKRVGPWLEEHGLAPVPADISMLWTAYGYGYLDADVPANLLIEYHRHARHRYRTPVRIDGGNQRLWKALAERLQSEGTTVRYATPVTRLAPTERGVELTADGVTRTFDEVVLACDPAAGAKLLPAGDALGTRLGRFRARPYLVRLVRVTGLGPDVATITPERGFAREHSGTVLIAIRQGVSKDLVLLAQHTEDAAGEPIPEDTLVRTMVTDLRAMGLEHVETLHRRLWSYFPSLASEDAGTWLELQALQGDRSLWVTGGAVSFEAMEHVARHARTLVRLGFGPGAPTIDELRHETAPSAVVVSSGPPVPAPLGARWSLEFLSTGASTRHTHVGAVLELTDCGDTDAVLASVAHLDATLEGLRVRFRSGDDGPLAFFAEGPAPVPEVRDLSAHEDPAGALRVWSVDGIAAPFTPDDPRLYRVGVARLSPSRVGLWLVAHHAIVDADGVSALLLQFVRAMAHGRPALEPSARPTVLDESLAAELRAAERAAASQGFWERRLAALAACSSSRSRSRPDGGVARPLFERTVPLERGVARRVQMISSRQGWAPVTFLAAAAGRVAAARAGSRDVCLGLVTADRYGSLLGPKPSRVGILPLGLEALPTPGAEYLAGCHQRIADVARHYLDGVSFAELAASTGFATPPWEWTVNHFEFAPHWPVGTGTLDARPIPRPEGWFALELATITDPRTGAMWLRAQGTEPDFDEASLVALSDEVLRAFDELTDPRVLWQLPGVGLYG